MAERDHRSYLRDNGPRAIDAGLARDRQRGSGRRYKDADDKSQVRPKRTSGHKRSKSKSDPAYKQRPSGSNLSQFHQEPPRIQLDVINQPSAVVPLGMEIEASVMISLHLNTPNQSARTSSYDSAGLFAVVSLLADTRTGERVPMEVGFLTGGQLFDSVHPVHCDYAEEIRHTQPSRLPLGFFSFSKLLIRQSGSYRLRITLVQTAGTGANSITAVDSELIKVERGPSSGHHRRHARMYS